MTVVCCSCQLFLIEFGPFLAQLGLLLAPRTLGLVARLESLNVAMILARIPRVRKRIFAVVRANASKAIVIESAVRKSIGSWMLYFTDRLHIVFATGTDRHRHKVVEKSIGVLLPLAELLYVAEIQIDEKAPEETVAGGVFIDVCDGWTTGEERKGIGIASSEKTLLNDSVGDRIGEVVILKHVSEDVGFGKLKEVIFTRDGAAWDRDDSRLKPA